MIAAGDDIHARREDLLGRIHRDARAAGGVLAVGHHQAHSMLLPQLGNEFLDRAPARLPYDVRDEQQFHGPTVTPRRPRQAVSPPHAATQHVLIRSRAPLTPLPSLLPLTILPP